MWRVASCVNLLRPELCQNFKLKFIDLFEAGGQRVDESAGDVMKRVEINKFQWEA